MSDAVITSVKIAASRIWGTWISECTNKLLTIYKYKHKTYFIYFSDTLRMSY